MSIRPHCLTFPANREENLLRENTFQPVPRQTRRFLCFVHRKIHGTSSRCSLRAHTAWALRRPTGSVTNYYYGDRKQPAADKAKSGEGTGTAPDTIDTTPIRTEILTYVSCIRPYLSDNWKNRYMQA